MRCDEQYGLTLFKQGAWQLQIDDPNTLADLIGVHARRLDDLDEHFGKSQVIPAHDCTQARFVRVGKCLREIFAHDVLAIRKSAECEPAEQVSERVQKSERQRRYKPHPPGGASSLGLRCCYGYGRCVGRGLSRHSP